MTDPVFSAARVVATSEAHAAVIWSELPVHRLAKAQEKRSLARSGAEAAGLILVGPTLTVWRMITPERIRIAPGLLVTAPFEQAASLDHVTLPAGSAAHLRLEGSFENMGAAWERLFLACQAQRWRPSGLNWEIYENDDTDRPPAADLYAQLG